MSAIDALTQAVGVLAKVVKIPTAITSKGPSVELSTHPLGVLLLPDLYVSL